MYLIIIQINLANRNILFFNVPHMSNCTYQSMHSYCTNYNTKDKSTKVVDHIHGFVNEFYRELEKVGRKFYRMSLIL